MGINKKAILPNIVLASRSNAPSQRFLPIDTPQIMSRSDNKKCYLYLKFTAGS